MFRWLFPAIALALLSLPVDAQTISRPSTTLTMPQAAPSDYQALQSGTTGWWRTQGRPGCWGWYHRNVLKGRYWEDLDAWQSWDGRAYGPESVPPWQRADQLPGAQRQSDGSINMGLDTSKIGQHGERYLRGGVEVAEAEAVGAMIGNSIKDDSNAPYLTVFDVNDQRRAQTVQALRQQFGDRARILDYNPTWPGQQSMLEGFKLSQDQRLQQTGQALIVQAPPDKDDKGNPTGFGRVLEAQYGPVNAASIARKVDPLYDPAKNGEGGGFGISWKWLWDTIIYPLILMVISGLGVGFFMRQRSPAPAGEAAPSSPAAILVESVKAWRADCQARAAAAKAQADEDARIEQALLALAPAK